MTNFNYKNFFPYKTARLEQNIAIEFALDAFINKKKKFVIIEAGTGIGKSAIGLTISRYLENFNENFNDSFKSGATFLTTQKILQDQYIKDFGTSGMKSIKSSVNYNCKFHIKNTCSESMRALRTAEKGSSFWQSCVMNCPYKKDKIDFIESNEGVTNFPYFLTETAYSGKLQPRNVLVIDEAHNIETELSKFVEVSISERFTKQLLKVDFSKIKTQAQAIKWIKNIYIPGLSSRIKHFESIMNKFSGLKEKIDEFISIAKQFELLDKHLCKVNRFLKIYKKDNWVFNDIPSDGRKGRKLEFKPIDVAPYSNDMLFRFGNHIILMSATILNKDYFCELLGINNNDAEFISIPTPFPVENRPILTFSIGKMSMGDINESLPKLVIAIKEILKNHKNEKGIIHCHTFKIANYIKKNIRSSRLLIHTSENRDKVLDKHQRDRRPTVLLSPSMAEGVDLSNDLSRFQIVCKVPYPYLGDKLIRKRMKRWLWWYSLQTTKTIVQSVGRSIRNNNDYAVTYILDSDWDKFYLKNKHFFPTEFKKAIIN